MSQFTSHYVTPQPLLSVGPRAGGGNEHIPENAPLLRTVPHQSATSANDANAPFGKPEFELFSISDILKMPRPRWLIRELLVEKTASLLSADSGSYKSFLALDMALCIALGRPFMGREVQQGTAVYVAAEGAYTLPDRLTAWSLFHGCALPQNFHVLRVPVDVANTAKRHRFVQTITKFAPSLIVLDTLSQCAVGRKENSNDEMAEFMRGMMDACEELGAHVQALHHNGKGGGVVRGAESIRANADTVITLDKAEDKYKVFVRCEKQRGVKFDDFALQGNSVQLPYTDEYGYVVTSLVFGACNDVVAPKVAKHPNAKRADATREKLLAIFDTLAAEYDGVKKGTWAGRATEAGIPESTAFRHIKAMEGNEIEERGEHQGTPLWHRKISTLTTLIGGSESCENEVQNHSHISHTPLGVRVVRVEPESYSSESTQTSKPKATHHPNRGGEA